MTGTTDRGVAGLFRFAPALLTLVLAMTQLVLLARVGDGLLPAHLGDPYGEADALRSAGYYAQHGLTSNVGLPNILDVQRFPDAGWLGDLRAAERTGIPPRDATPLLRGVYTRYPPLPNLLVGAMERVIGYRPQLFRLLPLAVGLAAFYGLAAALLSVLGTTPGTIAAAGVAALPMTSSHMAGLHYEGYACALLLIEFGLLLRWYADSHRRRSPLVLLGAIAFLQGWLSFDYAFVVVLAPLVVFLIFRDQQGETKRSRAPFDALVAGTAFTMAHIIHFLQVSVFYGSASAAWADWRGRAVFRASGSGAVDIGALQWHALTTCVADVLSLSGRHFGPFPAVWLAVFVVVGCIYVWRHRLLPPNTVLPLSVGLLAACLWVVAMPAMSLAHRHIVPRLFLLPLLTVMVVTIRTIKSSGTFDGHPSAVRR